MLHLYGLCIHYCIFAADHIERIKIYYTLLRFSAAFRFRIFNEVWIFLEAVSLIWFWILKLGWLHWNSTQLSSDFFCSLMVTKALAIKKAMGFVQYKLCSHKIWILEGFQRAQVTKKILLTKHRMYAPPLPWKCFIEYFQSLAKLVDLFHIVSLKIKSH